MNQSTPFWIWVSASRGRIHNTTAYTAQSGLSLEGLWMKLLHMQTTSSRDWHLLLKQHSFDTQMSGPRAHWRLRQNFPAWSYTKLAQGSRFPSGCWKTHPVDIVVIQRSDCSSRDPASCSLQSVLRRQRTGETWTRGMRAPDVSRSRPTVLSATNRPMPNRAARRRNSPSQSLKCPSRAGSLVCTVPSAGEDRRSWCRRKMHASWRRRRPNTRGALRGRSTAAGWGCWRRARCLPPPGYVATIPSWSPAGNRNHR